MILFIDQEFKFDASMETCRVAKEYVLKKYYGKVYCLRHDQTIESRIMQVNDMALKPSESLDLPSDADFDGDEKHVSQSGS